MVAAKLTNTEHEDYDTLIRQLNNAGLVTKWGQDLPNNQILASSDYNNKICKQLNLGRHCTPQNLKAPKLKLSYRAKFEEDHQKQLLTNFLIQSASTFDANTSQTLGRIATKPSMAILATVANSYGDTQPTPIGNMPGGGILANAYFDFLDSGFIKSVSKREAIYSDIWMTFLLGLIILVGSHVILWIMRSIKIVEKNTAGLVLSYIWPWVVLVVSSVAIILALRGTGDQIARGYSSVIAFSILASMFDFVSSIQVIFESVFAKLSSLIKSALVKLKSVFKDNDTE